MLSQRDSLLRRGTELNWIAKSIALLAALFAATAAVPAQASNPGLNGEIAFTHEASESGEPLDLDILSVQPDGTGLRTIRDGTAGDRFFSSPAWSPNGTRIAFAYEAAVPTATLPHGLEVTDANGTPQTIPYEDGAVFEITWSPTGAQLAFHDGGIVSDTVSGGPSTFLGGGTMPDWSPDGRWIVFATSRDSSPFDPEQPYEIYVMRSDGSFPRRLTNTTLNETYPSWSPDGSRIAFSRGPSGNADIYTMNPDGTGVVQLTDSPGLDSDSSWSPDGTKIAFRTQRNGAGNRIYTMNADGSNEVQLVDVGGSQPTWQPLPVNSASTHVRPKGATPFYASLVPAAETCTTPNRVHGPPLAFGSCSPVQAASPNLTVGAIPAKSTGFFRLGVTAGAPGPPDDTDAPFTFSLTNVMNKPSLSDYTGELQVRLGARITDREGTVASTGVDYPYSFKVPCTATADTTLGGACTLNSSFDAVLPGSGYEGGRTVWALDQLRVLDGGPDSDADTEGNNSLFMKQGVFVP